MNIVRCNVCGYVGEPKTKGSFLVTIILLCFGVFPGIIYEIWRRSGGKVCSSCGSQQITGTGMMKNNQPSKRNNKNTLLILAGVFVFMLIFVKIFSPVHNEETVSTDSSKNEEKQASGPVNNHSAIIMAGAYSNYTATAFPKLYDEVGEDGFKIIYEHDKKAAKMVSELNECDMVETSAYSPSMSIYPIKIVSFVDCKNGNRYYISNDEISKRN